jgi:hypothetical protein
MKSQPCDQETAVGKAARSGEWSPGLKAHVAQCCGCREIADISQWLQAAPQTGPPDLPNAGYLWWKAQLLSRQRAQKLALRSILMRRSLTYLTFAVILITSALYAWSNLKDAVKSLSSATTDWAIRSVANSEQGLRFLVYLVVAFLFMNVILTIRSYRVQRRSTNR